VPTQYGYSNDLVGAQNGWEIKANTKPYIALISKNPDAINEPMYCKCKYVELQCLGEGL